MSTGNEEVIPDSISELTASTTVDLTRGKGDQTAGDPGSGSSFFESPFPKFGRFESVRPIGGGGMGRVFEVVDPETHQSLALKTWQKEDPRLRASLAHEFLALSRLRHPNLVRLYEFSLSDPIPYFTMELLSGQDLLAWVRPKGESGPGFNEARLRSALAQLVEGLNFLHGNGLLHRDIKPSNVLVTPEGTVKLLDFGVTVALDRSGIYEPTVIGSTAGTDKYMSPAQAAGSNLTPADDWYSVGLVLFECLTGQFPFQANTSVALHEAKKSAAGGVSAKKRQPAIPDDLDELCTDLLRVDPALRPDGPAILKRLGVTSAHVAPTAPTRLLGRDRELASLREALAGVQSTGQPRFVLVHGNSGIGKSELMSHFLEETIGQGEVRVFRGRCYENVFAPYQAFQELLTDVCRYLRKLSPLERQAVLPTDIQALREAFPVFGDHGVVPTLPRADVVSTGQERRQQGFLALRELLLRIGPASAMQGALPLLFIDDLQWGDLDSLALLLELMRAPAAPPCLLLGSFRDEDAKTSPFLQALRETTDARWSTPPQFVDVRPLPPEDAARLASEILAGESGSSDELCQLIARQSRGNPLFINELVQYWRTQRDVSLADELSLDGLVQKRVAVLSDERRLLVQLVALAGRPVPHRELFRAAGLANMDQAWIQDLRDGHFLRSVGTAERLRLDTFHDRVREAVLSSLEAAQRRDLHQRWIAAVLPAESPQAVPAPQSESHGALVLSASLSTEYEFIAQQFLGAGEPLKAARYLRMEADHAAASFAFERAAALYRLALANHGSADDEARAMRTALGECLANTGFSAEAAGEFLAAAEHAPSDVSFDLRRRAAQRYLTSGHASEGLAVLRKVLTQVGLGMPETPFGSLMSLLWWRARLWFRGLSFSPRDAGSLTPVQQQRLEACWAAVIGLSLLDPIRAANYVARNLWLSLEMGDAAHIARALATYSGHAAVDGPSHAPAVEKILAIARKAADLAHGDYGWGVVSLAEGIGAHLQGRWRAALECSDKAEGLFRRCQRQDVTWEIDTAQTFAMWALGFQGDIAEMTRRQPKLVNQAIERNDRYARLNFGTVVMTYVSLAADEVQIAREMLAADEALLLPNCYHVQHHNASLARAFLELYDQQPQTAWLAVKDGWRPHVHSLLGRIHKVRIDFFQVYGRAAVGALAQDKQSGILKKAAQTAVNRLRREVTPWSMGMADAIEAGLFNCQQRISQASKLLESAAMRLREADMRLFVAAAERHHAQLSGDTDKLQQADESFARAGVRQPARMAAALVPGFGE